MFHHFFSDTLKIVDKPIDICSWDLFYTFYTKNVCLGKRGVKKASLPIALTCAESVPFDLYFSSMTPAVLPTTLPVMIVLL